MTALAHVARDIFTESNGLLCAIGLSALGTYIKRGLNVSRSPAAGFQKVVLRREASSNGFSSEDCCASPAAALDSSGEIARTCEKASADLLLPLGNLVIFAGVRWLCGWLPVSATAAAKSATVGI